VIPYKSLRDDLKNVDEMKKAAKKIASRPDLTAEAISAIDDTEKQAKLYAERERIMGEIAENAARVSPKVFEYSMPKHLIHDSNIMRVLPETHYNALMEGERLTEEEKGVATHSRLGWIMKALETKHENQPYSVKEYEEKVKAGEIDPTKVASPDLPSYLGKEIRRKIRYNISEKEHEHINQHMPEVYESTYFVQRVKNSTVQKLRYNPTFGAGKGEEIRLKKYDNLYQIVKKYKAAKDDADLSKVEAWYKEYYDKVSDEELKEARDKMQVAFGDHSTEELAGAPGSNIWKKPVFMDVMSKDVLREWGKKDSGEKRMVVVNALMAEKIQKDLAAQGIQRNLVTDDMKQILDWVRYDRDKGFAFYNIKNLETQLGITETPPAYTDAYKKDSVKKGRQAPQNPTGGAGTSSTPQQPPQPGNNKGGTGKPKIQINLKPKP